MRNKPPTVYRPVTKLPRNRVRFGTRFAADWEILIPKFEVRDDEFIQLDLFMRQKNAFLSLRQ